MPVKVIPLFVISGFILLLPPHLRGQGSEQTESVSINVSAQVVETTVELITMKEVDFANAQPSQGEIYINPVTSINAGLLRAQGTPSASVRISFQRQLELIRIGGSETLTFHYEISSNSENNQNASEILDQESRNLQLNANGNYFIWVGGRVNVENAVRGQYEGKFTVEIEYI